MCLHDSCFYIGNINSENENLFNEQERQQRTPTGYIYYNYNIIIIEFTSRKVWEYEKGKWKRKQMAVTELLAIL
jgi:hypothetical protein